MDDVLKGRTRALWDQHERDKSGRFGLCAIVKFKKTFTLFDSECACVCVAIKQYEVMDPG